MTGKAISGQYSDLGGYESPVREAMERLERMRFAERLWEKDAGIWKDDPASRKIISNALGWLDVAAKMEESTGELSDFTARVRSAGIRHVVHMGMGGSSLAPLAFQLTFGPGGEGLPLTVLDTTDPATVLEIERHIPVADTLFIEASKSGSTVESRSFGEYFYGRVQAVKKDRAGESLGVVTDPGSMLAKLADERGYRKIFLNFSDIGGRYSALSYFGLAPAALLGLDVPELLARARRMMDACGPGVPLDENPGVVLGAIMGELARRGRDKVTFLVPEPIATLGLWLEQLIAESTGKEGVGILPVAGEPIGIAEAYGDDRLFVCFHLEGEPDRGIEQAEEAFRKAGHPVVNIRMADRMDLCAEFYRWEIATAAAGAVLGINPFDQPNVQESKDITNGLLKKFREGGGLPEEEPTLTEGPLKLYAAGGAKASAAEVLSDFFATAGQGDFVALLAYLTEDAETERTIRTIRQILRDRLRLATTAGYGPRYLHSTGQYHKGGPNTGLFVELTVDDGQDADIPGQPYSFGILRRAQALGDLEALRKHGRRAIRVHLGSDVRSGLEALEKTVRKALGQ